MCLANPSDKKVWVDFVTRAAFIKGGSQMQDLGHITDGRSYSFIPLATTVTVTLQ